MKKLILIAAALFTFSKAASGQEFTLFAGGFVSPHSVFNIKKSRHHKSVGKKIDIEASVSAVLQHGRFEGELGFIFNDHNGIIGKFSYQIIPERATIYILAVPMIAEKGYSAALGGAVVLGIDKPFKPRPFIQVGVIAAEHQCDHVVFAGIHVPLIWQVSADPNLRGTKCAPLRY